MKAFLAACAALLACSGLISAPLRNQPTVLQQPDGSKYSCLMSGDEYYHRAHDTNGFTIVRNLETGWHVYAQKQGSELVPSPFIPGVDDPASRGLTPNLMPDESVLRQRFENWRGTNRDEYGRAPTSGTIESICIFVRFAGETEFGQSLQIYSDMHNSSTQVSMRGYFLEESAGLLTVNSTFYPTAPGTMVLSWLDANPRNYYYPQTLTNPIGYPAGPVGDPDRFGWIRLHTMFANAVNAIAPMVPPGLIIDVDGDMMVDNVSFVCRGNADATSALFWPHSWQMNHYGAVPLAYINMRQAVDYNFNLQYPDPLYVGYGGGIDPALVCHEFSHTLGFPDLYHYVPDGVNPCGYWDLMDYCYQVPQHHLVYMKWKYGGWFGATNPLPPAGTACTLNAVATNPFDHYMFQMPTGEQVWIEYRKAMGSYETRVPNSGLIFYRVDQTIYPWGNAGGPPDEVYVYRPYVSSSPPDGNINWAAFAWEMSQTAFNQMTDPNPFSQSMPGIIANMNIHSIESNNGSQMNFVVGTVQPVIWKGLADNNWFNPANWNTGTVPTAADFVIIAPVGGWFSCQVQPVGMSAMCQNLRNEHMFTVLPGATLQVNGNFFSIGRFFQDGFTQVAGSFTIGYWYAGSWMNSTTFPGAQLTLGGNCTFDAGTQIQMQVGQLIFANIGVSPPVTTFTSNSFGTVLFDLIVNKSGRTLTYTSMLPGMAVNLTGSLTVMAGSTFLIQAPHFFAISRNITVNPTGLLQVQDVQNVCTFALVGPPALQTISINSPNCYILHLDVQNNAAPILASSLDVRGNFTITLGTFIANNNTIFVRGNWTNNMGLGGFQKGTSRVVFNAPAADQTITVSGTTGAPVEDFYILELNKAAGSLNLNTAGQQVQCDFYDWTSGLFKVTDGIFNALSLLDGYIAGNIVCNAPGTINLTDTGGFGDLGANLTIQGGTVNVYSPTAGPASNATWGLRPGTLTMGSGLLNYANCGINVMLSPALFNVAMSGGIIQLAGDALINRPEFAPAGGLVVLISINPVNIGCTGGGAFYDLRLAVPAAALVGNVIAAGSVLIDPGCAINTTFNITAPVITLDGNLVLNGPGTISATTVTINGALTLGAGSVVETTSSVDVIGTLTCQGIATNLANMRAPAGQSWKMQVTGNLAASYTDFARLREEGVWAKPAAAIDLTADFDNCVFRDGVGTPAFLTIDNNQTLNISGIRFTTLPPGGFNIAKTVNSGVVNVLSSSGPYAGPLYENDPNTRINWTGYDPNLIVQSFIVFDANPYVADQVSYAVTVKNDSPNPVQSAFRVHLFKNRSTPPGWTESGDYDHNCPTLNPGETHSFNFTGAYSMIAEDWTTWLLIDPEGAIQETNETDNRDSETLTWHDLPAVDQLTITDLGGGSGRLDWHYSIWVSRYKIYECDDPYGAFDTYTGSTTQSFFDVTLGASRTFYHVIAERDDPFPSK